jgi:hypothetical protein
MFESIPCITEEVIRSLMNWPTQRSGQKKLTLWFQHSEKLLKKNGGLIDMLYRLRTDRDVDRTVFDRKRQEISNHRQALIVPSRIPFCKIHRDISTMRKKRGISALSGTCIQNNGARNNLLGYSGYEIIHQEGDDVYSPD